MKNIFKILCVIFLIAMICGQGVAAEKDVILEGIIKIPDLISYSDIEINLFTTDLKMVINGYLIDKEGHFLLRNLKEREYFLELVIKKFNRSIWERITLVEEWNKIKINITKDFIANIEENYEELKWLLRGIKYQPLKKEDEILKDLSLENEMRFNSQLFPFNADITYLTWYANRFISENEVRGLIPMARTDIVFKGKFSEEIDWFLAGFVDQNSIYTIHTAGGISYKKLDSHMIDTMFKYSEQQVYRGNNLNQIININKEELTEEQKDWVGSWSIQDIWNVSDSLRLSYSMQIDYVNFIKDSMQFNHDISIELFPLEEISVYSELTNNKKSYNQIINNDNDPPLIYQSFTNFVVLTERFKAQKDTELRAGLKLNAFNNLKIGIGTGTLISKDRVVAYAIKRNNYDYLNLFNVGDTKFRGLYLDLSYKFHKWLEAEMRYNTLSGNALHIINSNELTNEIGSYAVSEQNVSINIIEARLIATSDKTNTKVEVFYKYINGSPISFNEESMEESPIHLLNIEIKQAVPILRELTKCDIEFLFLMQNALHKDENNSIGDWERKSICYLPKGIAGGFILHF